MIIDYYSKKEQQKLKKKLAKEYECEPEDIMFEEYFEDLTYIEIDVSKPFPEVLEQLKAHKISKDNFLEFMLKYACSLDREVKNLNEEVNELWDLDARLEEREREEREAKYEYDNY